MKSCDRDYFRFCKKDLSYLFLKIQIYLPEKIEEKSDVKMEMM